MLNRMILISLIILSALAASSQGQSPKILLLAPEDNPEYLVIDFMLKIEAGAMISILEDAGYQVDVVTVSGEPITVGIVLEQQRIALVKGGMVRAQKHHKKILAAVLKGDSHEARQTMRAHLEQIRLDSEASLH